MMVMKTAVSTFFAYICARVLYMYLQSCNKNQVLVLVLDAWILVLEI